MTRPIASENILNLDSEHRRYRSGVITKRGGGGSARSLVSSHRSVSAKPKGVDLWICPVEKFSWCSSILFIYIWEELNSLNLITSRIEFFWIEIVDTR